MHKGNCEYCSKEFTSSHKRKFCSDSCRVMFYRKKNNPHQYTVKTCLTCGKEYRATHSSKFCSKECGLLLKNCLYCNEDFRGHKNAKFCSLKCKDSYKVRKPTGKSEQCVVCGEKYSITYGKKKIKNQVCSVKCSNILSSSKSGEFVDIRQIEDVIKSSVEQPTAEIVANLLNISHSTVISRAKEYYGSYREMIVALRGTYLMEDDKSLTANLLFSMIEYIYSIKGTKEKTFSKMINPITKAPLRIDYYIPDIPLAIEYHGLQHYKAIAYFDGENNSLKDRQFRDRVKEAYLAENNIPLVIFNYLDSIDENTIKSKLDVYLKSDNTEVTL